MQACTHKSRQDAWGPNPSGGCSAPTVCTNTQRAATNRHIDKRWIEQACRRVLLRSSQSQRTLAGCAALRPATEKKPPPPVPPRKKTPPQLTILLLNRLLLLLHLPLPLLLFLFFPSTSSSHLHSQSSVAQTLTSDHPLVLPDVCFIQPARYSQELPPPGAVTSRTSVAVCSCLPSGPNLRWNLRYRAAHRPVRNPSSD